MPAKSKAQFRLMKAICEGTYPSGHRGISKKVACEFVKGQKPGGLPQKKKPKSNYPKKKYKVLGRD